MTVVDPRASSPPGCPICGLVHAGLLAYLDDLIYSTGVDPHVRREIRLARGLCNRHAHLFTEVVGLALGVTLVGWDVIDTVREELAKHKGTGLPDPSSGLAERLGLRGLKGARERLIAALRPTRPCMGCEHQLTIERIYIRTLLEHLDDDTLQASLRASPGLCLPHFAQAIEWAPDARRLGVMSEIEQAALTRLSAELQELARKYDHRHQHEPVGAEGDSWRRAIDQISGARGVR